MAAFAIELLKERPSQESTTAALTRRRFDARLYHMVYSARALDAVFGALADPTRRAIVARLAAGPTTIGELARPFPVTLPAIGKHLTVLERARLVERWRDGRVRRVRLRPSAMRGVSLWLDDYRQLWERQLDRLAAYLDEPPGRHTTARRRGTRPDAR